MYDKVDSSMNFIDREKDVIKFWKENDVFEKSIKQNEGNEEFSFYAIFSAYRFDKHHKYYRSYDNLKMDALIAKTEWV